MSKFDLVYEKLLSSFHEEIKYTDSILIDYVSMLLSALKSQEYIDESLERVIKRIMAQKGGVKVLGLAKEGLPPLKIEMSSPEKDKFLVTVINVLDEQDQQTFESDLSTNCIEDVLAYIRQKRIQELDPEKNVETLPPAAGGEAQPGSTGSALPGMESPVAPTI